MHLAAVVPSPAISLILSHGAALLPHPLLNTQSSFPSHTCYSFFLRCSIEIFTWLAPFYHLPNLQYQISPLISHFPLLFSL